MWKEICKADRPFVGGTIVINTNDEFPNIRQCVLTDPDGTTEITYTNGSARVFKSIDKALLALHGENT